MVPMVVVLLVMVTNGEPRKVLETRSPQGSFKGPFVYVYLGDIDNVPRLYNFPFCPHFSACPHVAANAFLFPLHSKMPLVDTAILLEILVPICPIYPLTVGC